MNDLIPLTRCMGEMCKEKGWKAQWQSGWKSTPEAHSQSHSRKLHPREQQGKHRKERHFPYLLKLDSDPLHAGSEMLPCMNGLLCPAFSQESTPEPRKARLALSMKPKCKLELLESLQIKSKFICKAYHPQLPSMIWLLAYSSGLSSNTVSVLMSFSVYPISLYLCLLALPRLANSSLSTAPYLPKSTPGQFQ